LPPRQHGGQHLPAVGSAAAFGGQVRVRHRRVERGQTKETYGHVQPDYLRSEIDRPRFGTAPANDLAELPREGPARFLYVRCGTGRDFVLRVPPAVETALAANAWTYRLRPDEYRLEIRT